MSHTSIRLIHNMIVFGVVTVKPFIICRYNAHLKDAKKLGISKGISTGIGVGLTSFFIFFVHAVGFWFGAYLIQYQDATLGDVIIVSHYIKCTMLYVSPCMCVCRCS